MSERRHTSYSRSEREGSHRSHRSRNRAASDDDSYRRQRDDDRIGPPSSYHARAEMQIATRSNSGRRSSEWPGESRERSQYNGSRSHASEHDDRRHYSALLTQRRRSSAEDDEDLWENSSQGTKASVKDRLGSIFGKTNKSSSSERPERSSSHRSLPPSPRSARSESGFDARRRRFSQLDDRLDRGMGRLDALREEEPDGSIADIEPGEIRQLMAPSSSVQSWVNGVPLSEHAVATFNATPQVGRTRAQSEVPHSSRRMISQQRIPQSIAPGESAFSVIEPARNEAPSHGWLDRQNSLHGSTVKALIEEKHDSKEKEDIAVAIQESIKDLAVTAYGGSKAVKNEVRGWDEDEISVAIEQSIHDTGMSQRSNHGSSRNNNKYLTVQSLGQDLASRRREETEEADRRRRDAEDTTRMKRETEHAARTKREAENAVRRVREATDAARRQKIAEDADRQRRDADEAARRKRESDEAERRHEARLHEVKHAAQLGKHEIDERRRDAEHAARMRELELAEKARELAGTARARDAENARKVREERTVSQRYIADETNRLADNRSQFEGDKRKVEVNRPGNKYGMRENSSGRRNSALGVDADPPPYTAYDGTASGDRSAYPQQAPPTGNYTPQAIYAPSSATPHPVTVHSQVTVTQAMPSPQPTSHPRHPPSRSPHSASQTTAPSTSTGEIYRPPRRMGNIMPDSVTRIQQHYRFRRSLIDRNVHESRRTAEQGRTAIACLNRNEIADIDSEPRRTQELNVAGLEAFEADIELLDRLGGDQMAPPMPWAIPSLEAQSHGNYNQAHLREHIERLLAQQNDNSTAASGYVNAAGLGFAEYNGLGMNNTFGGYVPHGGGGAQFFEWYEEYRYQ